MHRVINMDTASKNLSAEDESTEVTANHQKIYRGKDASCDSLLESSSSDHTQPSLRRLETHSSCMEIYSQHHNDDHSVGNLKPIYASPRALSSDSLLEPPQIYVGGSSEFLGSSDSLLDTPTSPTMDGVSLYDELQEEMMNSTPYNTEEEDEEEEEELETEDAPISCQVREKQYKHKLRKQLRDDKLNKMTAEARDLYLKQEREKRKKKRKISVNGKSRTKETSSLLRTESDSQFYSYSSLSDLRSNGSEPDDEGPCQIWKGMFLAILSGVLFTLNNFLLVKGDLTPVDAILVRGFVHVGLLGLYYRKQIWCLKIGYVILQGICGALGLTFALFSVTLMPVPDALTIIFTSPLPTLILSIIIFGEKLTALKCISMAFLIMGVGLVCKPTFLFPNQNELPYNSETYVGFALASLSAICGGVNNVVCNYCKSAPHGVMVFWVAFSALALSIVGESVVPNCYILTLRGAELSNMQWGLLFGMAISGLVAYLSMSRALQIISPTLVASLRSLEILLAFTIEAILNSALPDPARSVGAAMVSGGICLAALQGWLNRPRNGYQSID